MNIALVVPTYNGGNLWAQSARAIAEQSLKLNKILIIDSSSSDDSREIALKHDFELQQINQSDFDHGGTRQMAVNQLNDQDILIFLTQDAILEHRDSLKQLVAPFESPEISAVYGRQLPHQDADLIQAHARLYNYPKQTRITSKKDIETLGLKTAFCSNSFSAYRVSALQALGGFPNKSIVSEDMYVAAKMILAGNKICYQASSRCLHSHKYTYIEEFKHYFDIGVFHSRNPWLLERFGKAEGEGVKFALSQISFLMKKNPLLLPNALLRFLMKYLGYRAGKSESFFSERAKSTLSVNRQYWER